MNTDDTTMGLSQALRLAARLSLEEEERRRERLNEPGGDDPGGSTGDPAPRPSPPLERVQAMPTADFRAYRILGYRNGKTFCYRPNRNRWERWSGEVRPGPFRADSGKGSGPFEGTKET